jgi:hypothetical protein
LLPVESLQINESRKAAQRALPAHIEIAEREFPERAVDGFAPAASGVIGLGDRAPAAIGALRNWRRANRRSCSRVVMVGLRATM